MHNLITAHKQSLGQGNIFTSVCQEFCPQGGLASQHALRQTPLGPDPPATLHAGTYSQQVGGMHPTGMQSCLQQIHC